MSDEERQARRRKVKLDPEGSAQAAMAARDDERIGVGLVARVKALVGEVVLVEGARPNFLGRLIAIDVDPMGRIDALVLAAKCLRVGAMNASGPNSTYELELDETIVPWGAVLSVTKAMPAYARRIS